MDIDTKIVEYISITQPLLEKSASHEEAFLGALRSKLDNLTKCGNLSFVEANKIYKEATVNPGSVFKYLDVPYMATPMGSTIKKSTIDPLSKWVYS